MDINTFNMPYQELIRESRNNFADYFQNYFSGYNTFFFSADNPNLKQNSQVTPEQRKMLTRENNTGTMDLSFITESIIYINRLRLNRDTTIILPNNIISIHLPYVVTIDRMEPDRRPIHPLLEFPFFPESLLNIYITYPLQPIPNLPSNLIDLTLTGTGISVLPELPPTLKFLSISYNRDLHTLPNLPNGLISLSTLCTSITEYNLPDSLRIFTFGGGGKNLRCLLPTIWPVSLEILKIGHEYIDEEEYAGDFMDHYYTFFDNPNVFSNFPDNLKYIHIENANISNFCTSLPSSWTTEHNVTKLIYIKNTNIDLTGYKYRNLLLEIKNVADNERKNVPKFFKYIRNNREIIYDNLMNLLIAEQEKKERKESLDHRAFNVAVASNNILGTPTNNVKPLAPEITKFISKDPIAQQKTIEYIGNIGGKKSRRSKKSRGGKRRSKKSTRKHRKKH
jgi:hypothetical protein